MPAKRVYFHCENKACPAHLKPVNVADPAYYKGQANETKVLIALDSGADMANQVHICRVCSAEMVATPRVPND